MHIGVQHVTLQQILVVIRVSTPPAMIEEFKTLAEFSSYGEIPALILSEWEMLTLRICA